MEGIISAEGNPALVSGCGGGSGGSLWLSAGKLLGAGTISANGGSGGLPGGGGGGGGRIAVYSNTNLFTGIISARGGVGATFGGAGTIYFSSNNTSAARVIVDNDGSRGANTLVTAPPIGAIPARQ